MNDFNNRIDAQRQILGVVNAVHWPSEPLYGLSGKALARWILSNSLDSSAPLLALLRVAAADLFFLANRSQEQVTEQYQQRSTSLHKLIAKISNEVSVVSESERRRLGTGNTI